MSGLNGRRLFCVGDPHLGLRTEGDGALKRLVAHLEQEVRSEDVVCLMGDLGVRDADAITCMELFEGLVCRKALVLGNHDVWLIPEDHHQLSDERMRFLHRKAQDRGFYPVQDEILYLGETAIIGSMGWYDETFRDPDLQIPDDAYARQIWDGPGERSAWADASYVRWSRPMHEMAGYFLAQLKRQLEQVRNVSNVVVMMHHLPSKRLLPYPWLRRLKPSFIPNTWRFANAFLGSERFADLIKQYPNVSRIVSGHVHWRGEARLTWRLRAYTVGGDYQNKELLILSDQTTTRVSF